MKRTYAKPYLIVEPFQIDTAVASCSGDGGLALGYALEGNCVPDADLGWFGIACSSDITTQIQPGDKACYDGPLGGLTFMNS